jgi:hypothetical protein
MSLKCRPHLSRRSIALLVGALVLSLSWSALALASTARFNGPAGSAPHAGVEFGAHMHKGHATSAYGFEFHNIPAQCQGSGTTAATDMLTATMTVNAKRKFGREKTINGGKLTVKVTGRFASDFSKAHGTLRVHGTVPGCPHADTGVVKWHAPRV